jgi:hypothetical protein
MKRTEWEERTASWLFLGVWFLAGFLLGCLTVNLYWRYSSDHLALASLQMSLYLDQGRSIDKKQLYLYLLFRYGRLEGLLFFTGLFVWGYLLVTAILLTAGFLFGYLLTGILLQEGWRMCVKSLLILAPQFLAVGPVFLLCMERIWRREDTLPRHPGNSLRHLAGYTGRYCLYFGATVILTGIEVLLVCAVLTKIV